MIDVNIVIKIYLKANLQRLHNILNDYKITTADKSDNLITTFQEKNFTIKIKSMVSRRKLYWI